LQEALVSWGQQRRDTRSGGLMRLSCLSMPLNVSGRAAGQLAGVGGRYLLGTPR
jgi:hypothetical protein